MKEKNNFCDINSTLELSNGTTETVFGIELETLELPPRADKKIEWSSKELKVNTRFLMAHYNKDENKVEAYSSAFVIVFTFFGTPEELIKHKEIKQIYDVVLVDTFYVIGANLKRKSDELEIQYMKYPEELVLKPGDTVKVPKNNGLTSFKDYKELISTIEIRNTLLLGKDDSQKATCDEWINIKNNEKVTNIYGMVYSGNDNNK